MFGYDYCFCSHKDCPRTDCIRHNNHFPVGVPVSVSDLSHYRNASGECEYYIPGRYCGDRLNLNTATEEELLALGELGKVRVAGILAYRESRGGFKQVSELLKCRAMGKKTYDKIADRVCV